MLKAIYLILAAILLATESNQGSSLSHGFLGVCAVVLMMMSAIVAGSNWKDE